MSSDFDPTVWLSCVEPLLARQCVDWEDEDKDAAKDLLAIAATLVRCKMVVPNDDIPGRILSRAQCLAHCADDLFLDIMGAIPATVGDRGSCVWCGAEGVLLTTPRKVG